MSQHAFFEGFAWAVPRAFCEPLGVCRFEEGDVLYDSPEAYWGEWSEGETASQYRIQIVEPKQSSQIRLDEADDKKFEANWETPVVFILFRHREGESNRISSTQGRLYQFLRTGDFDILQVKGPPPPLPILVIAATRGPGPEEIQELIHKRLSVGCENPNLFIAANDPTNPVAVARLKKIREALTDEFEFRECTIYPKEGRLRNWEEFSPTISFVGFCVDSKATENVWNCLKKALYRPSAQKRAGTDRFDLRKHGLFVSAPERKLV